MTASELTQMMQSNTASLVFANVLLQQLGVPVPAVPTLLIAGSLASGTGPLAQLLLIAVLASLLADWVWYLTGRAFGYRVLSGLCKLSINPGTCVTQTESRFQQWGAWSLVFAKFVPGFSTVAPPIAGSLRMHLLRFLMAAGVGAALWAGAALVVGFGMKDQLADILGAVERNGRTALVVCMLGLGAWLAWKLWQKYEFEKLATIEHITPNALIRLMESEGAPLLLDLRSDSHRQEEGFIPGAVPASHENLLHAVGAWPAHGLIVTLCACPEDAGAIHAAQVLLDQGFERVLPLKGGWDAYKPHLKKP